MNRKFLSLSLMMALALGASACRKKSSDEPIKPNPVAPAPSNNGGTTAGGSNNGSNGNTTTGENNSGNNNGNGGSTNAGNTNSGNAQESNASVTLTVPAGKSVTINGKTYTGNSQNKIFLDDSFKTLKISGNDLPSLEISGNNLTEVQIKEEMAKLTTLHISNSGKDSKKIVKLDLAAAKNLNTLVVADYNIGILDLSDLSNIVKLQIGSLGDMSETLVDQVVLPRNNHIEDLRLLRVPNLTDDKIKLEQLTSLKTVRITSTMIKKFIFKSPTLETFTSNAPTGGGIHDLILADAQALKSLTLYNMTFDQVTINNAPRFVGLSKRKDGASLGLSVKRLNLTGVNKDAGVRTLELINSADLEELTAPGLGLTLGQGVLSKFTKLNSSNTRL